MASTLEKPLSELSLDNDSLRAILECPVCYEFCSTPIFMCSNGHHICNKCQPSLTQCPTCRVDGQPTLRCLTLEKIADKVRVPCANKREGCEEALNAEDMAQHWRTCKYRYLYRCLLNITSVGISYCEWSGDRRALVAHVKEIHPGIYSEDDVVHCEVVISSAKTFVFRRLVSAHGELFWVGLQYPNPEFSFVDLNKAHLTPKFGDLNPRFVGFGDFNTAYIFSTFIGKKENAAKYRGKFVYSSNDGCMESTNVIDTLMLYGNVPVSSTSVLKISKAILDDCESEGKFTFTAQILKR